MSLVKMLGFGTQPEMKKPAKKAVGFFSNLASGRFKKKPKPFNYVQAAKKSFQRDQTNFIAVDAVGNRIKGPTETVAMDASIEEMKALQAGCIDNITPVQFGWYAGQGFIGYQNCAMIAQNAFVDKACVMPAKDAVRHGWDTTVNDGTTLDTEVTDWMREFDKKLSIKPNLIEWLHMGRVFGIRIAIPVIYFSDPAKEKEFYENPFNIDAVPDYAYQGWTQVDPYWITPELDIMAASNPFDKNFYEPTWWRVNGKRYHRSHLLIFRNGRVADILKPTYLYGAPSIPQLIAQRLFNAELIANEAPLLAASKRMTVLNVDISQSVANPEAFAQRMNEWADLRDNYGIKVVGEAETIQQFDTSLTDLDAIIMTQYQLVCAIARVPSTKMLGTAPKGFNATGEYDEASYHEELESLQENDATPFIDRHNLLTVKSWIMPKFNTGLFHCAVAWKPVDSPTAEEQAGLNKTKAETDAILVNASIIDGFDGRKRISTDPDSGYSGIPEIVPDGPGDREAQLEAEGPLEQPVNTKVAARTGGTGGEE